MKSLKFRAYQDERMLYQKKVGIYATKKFLDGLYEDAILMRFTGFHDKNGAEGWAGDLRRYRGKIYKVVDDTWRFRFERNLAEFGENESITVDEDVVRESELIGNVHEVSGG